MLSIQIAQPLSKEFFEAINLRKKAQGNKIDYFKEKQSITLIAKQKEKIVGTATIQLYPFAIGRLRDLAIADNQSAHDFIQKKLVKFADEYMMQHYKKGILLGKKNLTSQAS